MLSFQWLNPKIRFLTVIVVGLLFTSVVSAQKISDRERDGLKGAVKSVTTQAIFIKNNNPDEKGPYMHRLTIYNPDGNKSQDEAIYDKSSNGKYVYSYDAAGNLIQEEKYIGDSILRTTYAYNDKGQRTIETMYNGYFHAYLSYDTKGRLSNVKAVWGETVTSRFHYTYDELGRLIKEQRIGGGLDYEKIKTYNEQGLIATEANGNDPKDPYYEKFEYQYDEKGNVLKKREYDENGLRETITYVYEFDSIRNWIKQVATTKTEKGEISIIETTRTIIYY
jgi:hypothetical protein